MSHANAQLTPAGRLRLAKLVVEQKWTLRRAAERWNCSVTTAKRWADRYRLYGVGGHGGPVLAAGENTAAHTNARGATRGRAASLAPVRPGPDRVPARAAALHGAQDFAPLWMSAPDVVRSGHRRADPAPSP